MFIQQFNKNIQLLYTKNKSKTHPVIMQYIFLTSYSTRTIVIVYGITKFLSVFRENTIYMPIFGQNNTLFLQEFVNFKFNLVVVLIILYTVLLSKTFILHH